MAYNPADLRLPHWLLRLLDAAVRIRLPLAPSWHIGFTRPGVLFMGALTGVWVAAVYSGNNLLYLCGAMLMSLLLAGVGTAMYLLRSVPAMATFMPEAMHAGSPRVLRESMDFSSSFSAMVDIAWQADTPAEESTQAASLRLRCMHGEGLLTSTLRGDRRGVFQLSQQILTTEAPLGMWRLQYERREAWDAVVLPAQVPWQFGMEAGGEQQQAVKEGDEWRDLRTYVPGDVLARVHWRKVMHGGEWLVKRFAGGEQEQARDMLRVDLRLPAGSGRPAFERQLGQASFWLDQQLAAEPAHGTLILGRQRFDLSDWAGRQRGLRALAAAMPETLPPAGEGGMLLSLMER